MVRGINFVTIAQFMNTTEEKEYPFYIKAAAVLLGLVLIIYILFVLSDILVPLAFSVLIAILLNPLYVRLERVVPKFWAILISLLAALALFVGLFYFLSTQINTFVSSIPLLKTKMNAILLHAGSWTKTHFGLNLQKQITAITGEIGKGGMLRNTVSTILGLVGVLVLLPVYIFMILYYKPLILDFLFQVFSEKHSLQVAEILSETKGAVQSYMQGLMIETVIVSVMNSVVLLIIGVPSAIVIGLIGGLLNLLPYIGGIIAIALPVLMVTIVKEGFSTQLIVIIAYTVIQFIDNHIVVPLFVSKKVQINALMSVVVILLGGALWGVSGMFLSIPLIGVLKIIFDRVDGLKPWGKLLGDEVPTEHIGLVWQKRWDRIFKKMKEKKELEEKLEEKTDKTTGTPTA